jgi:hypothetical protein
VGGEVVEIHTYRSVRTTRQRIYHGLDGRRAQVDRTHPGSDVGECSRGGFTDTLGGAGHDNAPSRQSPACATAIHALSPIAQPNPISIPSQAYLPEGVVDDFFPHTWTPSGAPPSRSSDELRTARW